MSGALTDMFSVTSIITMKGNVETDVWSGTVEGKDPEPHVVQDATGGKLGEAADGLQRSVPARSRDRHDRVQMLGGS